MQGFFVVVNPSTCLQLASYTLPVRKGGKGVNHRYLTEIITPTPTDSISKVLDVANTIVKSGTDRNSLVDKEKWKYNSGDSELHSYKLQEELSNW